MPHLQPEQDALPSGSAPLVSVVIPSYNVEPYIAEAVNSAANQSYRNIEVIVVNDGSTDATGSVVRDLIRRRQDERIRVVDQANAGLSAARNTGIEHASGELIAFLDGDDAWSPRKVERHVAVLQSDQSIGLTGSFSSYMTESGTRTGRVLRGSKLAPTLHDMLRRNHFGNGSTIVVRRQCFERAGTFNTLLKSCEDYEMWCRILWATSYRAVCIPDALTFYRMRGTSLSFNPERFTENADIAMQLLRQAMPSVPRRVFRRGHAEHYRIAAWKALLGGSDAQARDMLKKALTLWPWLAFSDVRPALILAISLVPQWLRQNASTLTERGAARSPDRAQAAPHRRLR